MMPLNTTKKITYTALFTTLCVFFNLFDFPLNNTNSLSLVFIPCFIAGVFLGPWLGATGGFLGDLIAHLLHPKGVYIPFISISNALYALIPGLLFSFRKGDAYVKTVISYFLCFFLCTAGFNNLGLWLTYAMGKKTFLVYSAVRLPFQAIVSGVNCVLTVFLCVALGKAKGSLFASKFGQFVRVYQKEKNMKEQKAEEILALVDAKADRLAEEMIDKMLGIAQETAVTEEKQGMAVARGRYQYSFVAKLHQSADNVKAYYSRLKNLLLAYGWKSRGSWANESFYSGRKTHAKMGFSGKKLTLYLALNPADFKESKYYFKDVSARVKYASVPMAVSVKSTRGVKWAEELTVAMATALGKGKTEYTEQDFRLPYATQKQLLAKGLIKEKFLTEESAELQAVSEKAEGLYQEPTPAVRVSLKRKNRKR